MSTALNFRTKRLTAASFLPPPYLTDHISANVATVQRVHDYLFHLRRSFHREISALELLCIKLSFLLLPTGREHIQDGVGMCRTIQRMLEFLNENPRGFEEVGEHNVGLIGQVLRRVAFIGVSGADVLHVVIKELENDQSRFLRAWEVARKGIIDVCKASRKEGGISETASLLFSECELPRASD
ncbi:hypothetical protein K440DRAFT_618249 [Wilcoxina mikolae CBS 423.85]|nr:hypothetical protein K440DRAFT_618249 [Wilcoxina mikolae CBS 423.85]